MGKHRKKRPPRGREAATTAILDAAYDLFAAQRVRRRLRAGDRRARRRLTRARSSLSRQQARHLPRRPDAQREHHPLCSSRPSRPARDHKPHVASGTRGGSLAGTAGRAVGASGCALRPHQRPLRGDRETGRVGRTSGGLGHAGRARREGSRPAPRGRLRRRALSRLGSHVVVGAAGSRTRRHGRGRGDRWPRAGDARHPEEQRGGRRRGRHPAAILARRRSDRSGLARQICSRTTPVLVTTMPVGSGTPLRPRPGTRPAAAARRRASGRRRRRALHPAGWRRRRRRRPSRRRRRTTAWRRR